MVSRPPSSNRVLTWALLPLVLLLTVCTKTEETPPPPATEPAPGVAAPTELDLWAGVPPLAEEPGDLSETIEPRPGPAKPKTVGERIELPFEPKKVEGGPVVPPGTKLEVERYGPVGAEGLVGAVRVAFNQPMVPLASVESLKAKPIPLTIDPMPPGQARWLGTQVMAWEPEGRMPFSTTYEVTVPAGVKAVSGETLDKAVSWTFSTPTLALESISPYDGSTHVALSPTITLVFNQPIEKTALTGALSLRGKGSDVALTAVPAAKIEASADESVVWREKRTLRLQPKTTLAANTTYTLKLPAGTFGEGPDKSAPIVARFTTYPPLRVSWPGCGGSPCWSTSGIQLQATNRITDAKIESKVHVTPAVDEMTVNASWNGISIGGRFDGGGKYTVTVDAGVVDVYGQTLASPFKKTITLGPPYPQLSAKTQTKSPGVIERAGSKEIKLAVAGLSELEVEAVALASSDIGTALKAYPERETRAWPSTLPATSYTDTLDVSATLKRPDDFTVDLAKVIEPGRNAVWLNVRSEEVTRHGWKQRLGYHNLFEITDLGVAAALDRGTGLVQVTTLSDGAPVAGAKLTIHSSYSPSGTLWKGTTDADGLATPDIGMSSRPGLLVVETADDFAFARLDNSDLRGRWGRTGSNSGDEPRLFIYTDRTPYKPGDTIHLSGIVRKETRGPTGGVDLWAVDGRLLRTREEDSRNRT
ncbi:MAG: Ig-like domain-containing protein [Myxococcota bacterium]